MNNRYKAAAALLVLSGATACADLVVPNTNTPDRGRALATPGDVESLVAGGYKSWYGGEEWQQGTVAGSPGYIMGTQSFMWSSTAANQGSHEYSQIPRVPIQNSATHQEYVFIATSWQRHYRALASVADGLRTITSDTVVSNGLGGARVLRARIFGKFVQGLAHGSLALAYDKGYVVDENVQTIDDSGAPLPLGEPVSYAALNAAAIAKLDTAIALAGTAVQTSFIPKEWMATTVDVTMPEFVRIANSFKARYRANIARTPAERGAVNWTQVLAETGAGIKADFNSDRSIIANAGWCNQCTLQYMQSPTFQQLTYFIHGMADQSGDYQAWLARPLVSREPNFANGTPVLIVTPDLRFARGDTLFTPVVVAAGDSMLIKRNQVGGKFTRPAAAPTATRTLDTITINNRGKYYGIRVNATTGAPAVSSQWTNPNRGVWRHSWYSSHLLDPNKFLSGAWPEIAYAEMRLLAAEAHFRLGQLGAAADSVNKSRVAQGGLNATDADGLNTSCVPKLPNGSCGNLWEMLKWEKRNETWGTGAYKASWYFDGRGWGDLYIGTPLQLPIPEEQAFVLGLGAPYTFGGVGGPSSAPRSSYAW
ncbi:MAG TPA: RagB/SusD family nutrient uptake outer membrane protein, partial [Longimicrobium sp.]|nr:RagB/SusD family nutrient uptake outer membrane protein [Longimicrobium sp.]